MNNSSVVNAPVSSIVKNIVDPQSLNTNLVSDVLINKTPVEISQYSKPISISSSLTSTGTELSKKDELLGGGSTVANNASNSNNLTNVSSPLLYPISLLENLQPGRELDLGAQEKANAIASIKSNANADVSSANSPITPIALSSSNSLTLNEASQSSNSANKLTVSSLPQADLVGCFGNINLPKTIEFGDRGKAQVIITNQGNAIASGPVTVKLYISTDGDIDKNDALLASEIKDLNLKPGQSITLNLNYENNTSIIAPGAYFLLAEVDSENQIPEQLENNNVTSQLVSAPKTDAVIDWNAIALNAIQAEGEAGRGVAPTDGSRLLALMSTAVYDTVSAFNNSYTPYAVDLNAPAGASLQAAAVGAAYRVLSTQLPEQNSLLLQQVFNSLTEIKDSPLAEMKGFMFGQSVADQSLALRNNDGSDDDTPYAPPAGDYVWKPETSGPTEGVAVGANWGKVTPWAIDSVAAFTPDGGLKGRPDSNPDLYAEEIEEVRLYGGLENTAVTTTLRNADQTELAVFWAYDRPDTFRPYGQLNQIAEEIAVREGNSLEENASLFAALNTAMADAVIVAWDAKYKEVQPRPDDVIAGGFAANDGMNKTVPDSDWKPLLSPLMGFNSPPFPDYISGHSAMGGAFAGVMEKYFGDDYVFPAVSQELPGVIRHFDGFYEADGTFRSSFHEAGKEDALSRIYGGVHVREACVESFDMGLNVGNFVGENLFQLG